MQANYHTHTYRCRHAGQWGDEEYVQAALAGGYRVLGFSDHTPWKYHSDYVSGNERMPMDALEDYIASVQALRAQYRGRLTMYLGLECEYFPDYLDWLREMHGRMDYLILGNHFYKTDEFGAPYFGVTTTAADIYRYLEMTLAGMATGLYRYLAHPELPVACYPAFDDVCRDLSRQICRADIIPTPSAIRRQSSGASPPRRAVPPSSAWTRTARRCCRTRRTFLLRKNS